jgi:hypothetical protein
MKQKCERFVVENVFGILKKTFRKLIDKSKPYITFFYEMFSLVFYCTTYYTTKETLKININAHSSRGK